MTRIITGNSAEAMYVAKLDKENEFQWGISATFSKQAAYDDLWTVWKDCSVPDWDCVGATPIDEATYQNAYRFIESLPLGFPLPDVGAEPDGHLTFEWYHHPRWLLSISIGPDDTLYYAGVFGLSTVRGAEHFNGEVSNTICRLISQVVEDDQSAKRPSRRWH